MFDLKQGYDIWRIDSTSGCATYLQFDPVGGTIFSLGSGDPSLVTLFVTWKLTYKR